MLKIAFTLSFGHQVSRHQCVSPSGAYFDVVGIPSNTVSHSLPSLLEARVYCDAAGVAFVPTAEMNPSDVPEFTLSAPEPLVLGWPEEDGGPPVAKASAVCLLKRQGGLVLAVPAHFFNEELLAAAQASLPSEPLGPSECSSAIITDGRSVERAMPMSVLVIDCSDAVCATLRLAGPPGEGSNPPPPKTHFAAIRARPACASSPRKQTSGSEGPTDWNSSLWTRETSRVHCRKPRLQLERRKQMPSRHLPKEGCPRRCLRRSWKLRLVLPALNSRLDELARRSRLEETGRAPPTTARPPLHAQIGQAATQAKGLPPQAAGEESNVVQALLCKGVGATLSWTFSPKQLCRLVQSKLASKKGGFFTKVKTLKMMQAGARRMDPTQACDLEPSELKQSMAKYVERFSGSGQVRSIALIQ